VTALTAVTTWPDVAAALRPARSGAMARRHPPSIAQRAYEARHRAERAAARRRRRLLTLALGLGAAVAASHAGAALGGSSLATPERAPQIVTHVVQPGDTLWSIARELEPGGDPRPVVDALVRARGGSSTLVPGETITWMP
jgi:nucleoid-associated protein YgaU